MTPDDLDAIRRVARSWTAAIEAADLPALQTMMTDDIVVVHGNGRIVAGKEAVLADLTRSLESFVVTQAVESDETIVAGDWAFERARVRTRVVPRAGGPAAETPSVVLTILRRLPSGEWAVARTIGVVTAVV